MGAAVRVERLTLRWVRAELAAPFSNRWQTIREWTKLLVAAEADGETGYGECTAMQTPYYSYETIDTAWHLIETYLAPLLFAAEDHDPRAVPGLWAHISGHEEAKAAVECALWDLRARLDRTPLCAAIGGAVRDVPTGGTVSLTEDVDSLIAAVAAHHERGDARVRVKIRPGWDVVPVRALRAALPHVPIIADANAAYRATDMDLLRAVAAAGPLAIEQPFIREHLPANAELQARVEVPVCLDESVRSFDEAEVAVAMNACRAMNVKVGRVGGIGEALRVHDLCAEAGIATFVGAKYDFGVGRWTNLALATLPNMTWASDCAPTAHYYAEDGVDTALTYSTSRHVRPLDAPGVGVRPTGALVTVRETELS